MEKDIAKPIFDNIALIFFAMTAVLINCINIYTESFDFVFVISIGLMGFVGLFLSLVLRRDLDKKRENMILDKRNKLQKFINSETKQINKSIKEGDTDLTMELLSDMSEEISIFQNEENVLKVDKHMKLSIAFSVVTIIIGIFNVFLTPTYPFHLSVVQMMTISLMLSIYYMTKLLIAWHKITN